MASVYELSASWNLIGKSQAVAERYKRLFFEVSPSGKDSKDTEQDDPRMHREVGESPVGRSTAIVGRTKNPTSTIKRLIVKIV